MRLPNEDGWLSVGWMQNDGEEESRGGEGKTEEEKRYWEQSKRKGMQTERGRESNERLIEDSKRTGDTIKMEEVGAHVEVFPMQTEPTTGCVSWCFGPGPNPKECPNLLQDSQNKSSVSNFLKEDIMCQCWPLILSQQFKISGSKMQKIAFFLLHNKFWSVSAVVVTVKLRVWSENCDAEVWSCLSGPTIH